MKHSFLIIGIMLLSSCGGFKQTHHQEKEGDSRVKTNRYLAKKLHKKDSPALDLIRLQEAKLSDIPVPPFSSKPIPKYFEQDQPTIMLGYEDTLLSPSDIKEFYIKEMERLGWEIKEQFFGCEVNLRFKRPDRICLISIRSAEQKNKTTFVISIGSKETKVI